MWRTDIGEHLKISSAENEEVERQNQEDWTWEWIWDLMPTVLKLIEEIKNLRKDCKTIILFKLEKVLQS